MIGDYDDEEFDSDEDDEENQELDQEDMEESFEGEGKFIIKNQIKWIVVELAL